MLGIFILATLALAYGVWRFGVPVVIAFITAGPIGMISIILMVWGYFAWYDLVGDSGFAIAMTWLLAIGIVSLTVSLFSRRS
jgi:hypothetical protein